MNWVVKSLILSVFNTLQSPKNLRERWDVEKHSHLTWKQREKAQIAHNNTQDTKLISYAQSLPPPSAWRTYTIYPQQIIDKAKREIPARHPDNVPNYPIGKNGTTVKLVLHIDEHGNITQKIDHIINLGWVHT